MKSCQAWYDGADKRVRKVAGYANGNLLQQLLCAAEYCDAACAELLRQGADVIGKLTQSGIGEPLTHAEAKSFEQLRQRIESWNKRLLAELREDDIGPKLMDITSDDYRKGRMSKPRQLQPNDLKECLLCPRFGVVQQKSNGRLKARAPAVIVHKLILPLHAMLSG